MTKISLRSRYLQQENDGSRRLYRKPRNNYGSLMRKSEYYYFAKLNEKNITGNKNNSIFWKNKSH